LSSRAIGHRFLFLLCPVHSGDGVEFDIFDELERQKVTKSRMKKKKTY